MDIALPPCLQRLFKDDNRIATTFGRPPPQDQYGGGGDYYGPPGGAGYLRKRGRPRYNENPEDKGEVVHNEYPSKDIAISKQDFAPLIHNFIRHRDNKKWVPTSDDGTPLYLKFHYTGSCFSRCKFRSTHGPATVRQDAGLVTLIDKCKALKLNQRAQKGAGKGANA